MIEKSYTVVAVKSFMDGVFMHLKPQDLPTEQLKVLEPAPQSEEEKLLASMMKTGLVEIQKITGAPPRIPPSPPSPFTFRIYLTHDEYKELGKPTISDILTLTITKSEE